MSKLYFIHGVMRSGKSLDLLKTAHNYESQNKKVLVFTSSTDTRAKSLTEDVDEKLSLITTRIGINRTAILIDKVDLMELAEKELPDAILVDEAQFLTKEQALKLTEITDELSIPVMCWGLKNDFKCDLFEGSYQLMIFADSVREIKTVCTLCNRKATMNLRKVDGFPVFEGSQIMIGDTEYEPLCRPCYLRVKQEQYDVNNPTTPII